MKNKKNSIKMSSKLGYLRLKLEEALTLLRKGHLSILDFAYARKADSEWAMLDKAPILVCPRAIFAN
jgi:hypothetical protein